MSVNIVLALYGIIRMTRLRNVSKLKLQAPLVSPTLVQAQWLESYFYVILSSEFNVYLK